MDSFSLTVKFLQHPALLLREEIGSPAPGGCSSPSLLSAGSLWSQPPHKRVNGHTFFWSCRLLGQPVLCVCIKWEAKGQPGPCLLICCLPYCLTFLCDLVLLSRDGSVTYFSITFGPYGLPLNCSSFHI